MCTVLAKEVLAVSSFGIKITYWIVLQLIALKKNNDTILGNVLIQSFIRGFVANVFASSDFHKFKFIPSLVLKKAITGWGFL